MPSSYYIDYWMSCLAYGDFEAQYASLMALRSHGYEAWLVNKTWEVKPPGKEVVCLISQEKS